MVNLSQNRASNKRKMKLPAKFNDHEVSTVNQMKTRNECNGNNEESRVDDTEAKKGESDVTERAVNEVFQNNSDRSDGSKQANSSKNGNKEINEVNKDKQVVTEEIEEDMGENSKQASSSMDCNNEDDLTVVDEVDINKGGQDSKMNGKAVQEENKSGNSSYASMVKKDEVLMNKKLHFVAPKVSEEGTEFVIFDEEIVMKGGEKWSLTACGYFVGHKMGFNELKYHLRRMWAKYGLGDIVVNSSGVNLFKFKNKEGMEKVFEQSPWMVNNVPLFVQKWNPEIGMQKSEPKKMPLWIKMMNIPVEAWSVEGISAMASSIGIPLMMDNMTAHMCQFGVGRSDYARVLVEVEATKQLKSCSKSYCYSMDANGRLQCKEGLYGKI